VFILHSRIPGFPPGILHVLVNGRNTEIHVLGDKVYETRVSISELAEQLTEDFIRIHRGCLVAVRVIHDITDRVYLNNGETLELTDYSPEIDTYLKVICFPTFPGHCGCILFDIHEIEYIKSSDEAEKALQLYGFTYLGKHNINE
jgi:hypothetical protein